MDERQLAALSAGIEVSSNLQVDVIDHMHGDEGVPMRLVEHDSGQEANGVSWFRYVMECPRNDHERIVLVLRQKIDLAIPGMAVEDPPLADDDRTTENQA